MQNNIYFQGMQLQMGPCIWMNFASSNKPDNSVVNLEFLAIMIFNFILPEWKPYMRDLCKVCRYVFNNTWKDIVCFLSPYWHHNMGTLTGPLYKESIG